MEQPLSHLNQGLNPVRAAGQWGQLVGLPAASPAIDSRVALPVAAPLWLALQPYANARLCLFEVDRPESRSPVPIRRHVIDCFLEQGGIVGGYNDTALTDPGDVLLRGYLCRSALLPVSTSNTFDWLAAELDWATPGFRDEAPLPWDPTLLGTVQAPCQGVMWLGDLGASPAAVRGWTAIRSAGPVRRLPGAALRGGLRPRRHRSTSAAAAWGSAPAGA